MGAGHHTTSMIKNPLFRVPLRYGLIGSAFSVVMFLFLYLIHKNPLITTKIFDVIVLLIFLVFAMKDYRSRQEGGKLFFWQGMTVGMVVFIVVAALSAIFIYFMLAHWDTDLLQSYINDRIAYMELNKTQMLEKLDEPSFDLARDAVLQTSAFDLAIDDFLKKSFIGLFLTIILSLIFRKQ